MRNYDRFWAIFNPKRTDDLQNGAQNNIGQKIEFMVENIIEDGEYKGQYRCSPTLKYISNHPGEIKFNWVPECDLDICEWVYRGEEEK
jgi:hypothetical protein